VLLLSVLATVMVNKDEYKTVRSLENACHTWAP